MSEQLQNADAIILEPGDAPGTIAELVREHGEINGVSTVVIEGSAPTPDDILALWMLPDLEDLHLVDLPDFSLDELLPLNGKLQGLQLTGPQMSLDGVDMLAAIESLSCLSFDDCAVNDDTVASLASHRAFQQRLRLLYLGGTEITDDVGQHLVRFNGLRVVDVRRTAVTDELSRCFKHMGELQVLGLPETQLGRETLEALAELDRCELLLMGGTPLYEADIPSLLKLRKLKSLDVRDTDIGLEHEASFWEALPRLRRLGIGSSDGGDVDRCMPNDDLQPPSVRRRPRRIASRIAVTSS